VVSGRGAKPHDHALCPWGDQLKNSRCLISTERQRPMRSSAFGVFGAVVIGALSSCVYVPPEPAPPYPYVEPVPLAATTRAGSSLRSGLALGTRAPYGFGAMGPWPLRAQLGKPASKSRGTAARRGTECATGTAFAGCAVRNTPNPSATSGPDVAGPVTLQNLSGERRLRSDLSSY
jgi:hypothetical protein